MSGTVSTSKGRRAIVRASVREACLIGLAGNPPGRGLSAGDRVRHAGRVYRVEATQEPGPENATAYVHLTMPAGGVG